MVYKRGEKHWLDIDTFRQRPRLTKRILIRRSQEHPGHCESVEQIEFYPKLTPNLYQPVIKNTANGGKRMATMIRTISPP